MLHYVHIQNNDSNCGCLKNEQVAKYKLWHIVASTSYIILRQNNLSLYCNAICTRYILLNSARKECRTVAIASYTEFNYLFSVSLKPRCHSHDANNR